MPLTIADPDLSWLDLPDGADRPGGVVAVAREGEVAAARVFGMADIEAGRRARLDTVFDVASTSKQVAALAAFLLAHRGLLSLSDPLSRHLPELPRLPASLTLGHLVHHLGGLRDYGDLRELSGLDDGADYGTGDIIRLLARQSSGVSPPGAEWNYNNSGYVLLAEAVARALGRPFAEAARELVLGPFGMAGSAFVSPAADGMAGRARGYGQAADGRFRPAPGGQLHVAGDGGLLTTAADLARFDRALLDPALCPEPVREAMLRPPPVPYRTFYPGFDYAGGLFVGRYAGETVLFHGGNFAGFRAEFMRFPGRGLAIIVLLNEGGRDPLPIATAVADRLVGPGGGVRLHRYWLDRPGRVVPPGWARTVGGRYACPDLGVTYQVEPGEGGVRVAVAGAGVELTAAERGGLLRPTASGTLSNGRLRLMPSLDGGDGLGIALDRTWGIACRRLPATGD